MRREWAILGVLMAFAWLPAAVLHAGAPTPSISSIPSSPLPPAIASLVRPKALGQVLAARDIDTEARLDDHLYSYHVAMLVHAGLERTRGILTDYRLYSKLVPYVDKTEYSPDTHILLVEGGIWKWRLRSWVRFTEIADRWVHYRIVGGHFRGLEGNLYFEPAGEKGTLVYFDGSQRGEEFPPRFVITTGAEIVFGFTAKRMRNYLESEEPHGQADPKIPQPRSHL